MSEQPSNHFIVMFIYKKWKAPEKHPVRKGHDDRDLEHLLEKAENEETRKSKTAAAKNMANRSKTAPDYGDETEGRGRG